MQLLLMVSADATGSFTGQGRSHTAQPLHDSPVRRMRRKLSLPNRLIAPPSGQR
jgi:hypothetical protein